MDPAELPQKLYWYAARLQPTRRDPTGVVDGDTMHITQDMGDFIYRQKVMRVANANCPELKDPGTVTNPSPGQVAKQFAIAWFQNKAPMGFYIHTHLDPEDRYGRVLAMIYAPDGSCYNDDVVGAGHAVPYEVEVY